MNSIMLDHVTYRYRPHQRPALDNISLQLNPGDRVCIMGANGSGKTTLVRFIAGLLPNQQTTGNRPNVAFLFQNPDNQMVAVTVEKELAFGLENVAMPTPDIEKRINLEAAQFDITHLLRRLSSELSGGEKQRVALASVLVGGPSILILDEPDAFLDQRGKQMLNVELERIRAQHPSLVELRIAQSIPVARQYPRVLVMAGGQIIADGAPDSVLTSVEKSYADDSSFVTGLSSVESGAASSIHVENIEVQLGGRTILGDLNLTLSRARTLCIVGATGSGKSTLGHVLAGLVQPSAGLISFVDADGKVIDKSRRAQVITAVLQQPERQFFLPTCAEEVALGPRNLGLPIDDAAVDLMLLGTAVKSENLARRDPFSLSTGEKRRLAFAVALAMATPFIIFDEPTAGLDFSGIHMFIQLSDSLRHERRGQVIITHEAGIVRALADEVLVLEAGRGRRYSRSEFFRQYPWQALLSQELDLNR